MALDLTFNPLQLGGLIEPLTTQLNIPAEYSGYVAMAGALFGLGLFGPLIGAVIRLGMRIVGDTARCVVRSIRGINLELARVIYRHGPIFSRHLARPLAVAVLIGAGYLVYTAGASKSSSVTNRSSAPAKPVTCEGEIVSLTCPNRR